LTLDCILSIVPLQLGCQALFDTATTASGHPVLVVGGQQLAFLVTTPCGRAVLALPNMNVPFVRGPIQLYQLDHATYNYRNSHQSALVGGDTLGRAEA